MTQKKDIKDVLNSFSPEPPVNGWANISAKMSEGGMQDIKSKMSDFHPVSKLNHWKFINRKLIFNRFVTFKANRFNLVYLLLILITISGSTIIATATSKQNKNNTIASNNNYAQTSVNSQDTTVKKSAQINKTIATDKTNESRENITETKNKPADEYFIAPTEKKNTPNNKKPTTNLFTDNKKSTLTKNELISPKNLENFNGTDIFKKTRINRMPSLILFPINMPNFLTQITNFTPLPDTLGLNVFGEPILSEKSKFGLSFSILGNYPINTYEANPSNENYSQNQYIANIFNNNENPVISYSADLGVDYIERHCIISSGIGFQQIKHRFDSNVPTTLVDSTPEWNQFTNHAWDYDTTYYINIDTLAISGDTLYLPYVDSTWIAFQDSTIVMNYDSTAGTKNIISNNIVRYINIPLWIGYRESTENWEFHAQFGLITSIPVYQKTVWYDSNNTEFIQSKNAPLNDILLTGACRTYIARKIDDHWLIGIEPSYYYKLNQLFDKDYPLNTKQHIFRLGFRVQYQF